jgi:hypothetical protein
MASWIDDLRSRCGPLTDAALMFAAHLGVERDPPAGAAGLLALARDVERHLGASEHEEEDERLFVELAGSYLGVLLCGALPQGRHASRRGRHGLMFGASAFFDPFAAIETLLDASDVRGGLVEQVALAEQAARSGADAWPDVQERVLPRLVGERFLSEVMRKAGAQPLFARELVPGVHLLLLVSEQRRRRYVDARELGRWLPDPETALRAAVANLAARSDEARLVRVEADEGSLVVARTGDGLDASRLLLPGLHDVLAPELGSPFAAAVPHRDALFACSLSCPRSLLLLRDRAAGEASRSAHPISPALLRVLPGGRIALL